MAIMDAAPVSGIQSAPPAAASSSPPIPHAPPLRDPIAAWPQHAQLAGAFFLGVLATILLVRTCSFLRSGAEPTLLESPEAIHYRVDLNDARRAELLQLPGVGPSLAARIEEYRQKNGAFRSVDDLRNVPGIGPTTLERLRPLVFVRIAEPQLAFVERTAATPPSAPSPIVKGNDKKTTKLTSPIDINRATLAELQKLPGIGPKLSQRIVDEREKKRFATVSDLRRVPGIGPKTYEKIEPYVTVENVDAAVAGLKVNGP
jgi:competence protein ComEA